MFFSEQFFAGLLTRGSIFRARFGGPWQLFVDGDGAGHVFCGGFGESATRPRPQLLLPAVAAHLQRLQAQAAARAAAAAAAAAKKTNEASRKEEEQTKAGPPAAASGAAAPTPASSRADDEVAHTDEHGEAGAAKSADATQGITPPPEEPARSPEAPVATEARDMAAAVSYLNRIFELSLDDAPPPTPVAEAAEASGAPDNAGGGAQGREALASSASVEFLNRLFNQPAAGGSGDSENI